MYPRKIKGKKSGIMLLRFSGDVYDSILDMNQ